MAIAETRTQEFPDTQKCRPHRRDVWCEDIPCQSSRFIRRLYPHRESETEWLFSSQFLNSHTPPKWTKLFKNHVLTSAIR